MPATQVEFDYRDKSFDGVVNRAHREKGFGVGHEAIQMVSAHRKQVDNGGEHTW